MVSVCCPQERGLFGIVVSAFEPYGAHQAVAAGLRLAMLCLSTHRGHTCLTIQKTGLDRKLIALDDPHEIKSWCESLGCTERELREHLKAKR